MLPEQIPGTLFVILLALVAYATGQWDALMLLSAACAVGWLSFHPLPKVAKGAMLTALTLWVFDFLLVLIRIL